MCVCVCARPWAWTRTIRVYLYTLRCTHCTFIYLFIRIPLWQWLWLWFVVVAFAPETLVTFVQIEMAKCTRKYLYLQYKLFQSIFLILRSNMQLQQNSYQTFDNNQNWYEKQRVREKIRSAIRWKCATARPNQNARSKEICAKKRHSQRKNERPKRNARRK